MQAVNQYFPHLDLTEATAWQICKDSGQTYAEYLAMVDDAKAKLAAARRNRRAKISRAARHQAFTDANMVRVRGNLGGVYYE